MELLMELAEAVVGVLVVVTSTRSPIKLFFCLFRGGDSCRFSTQKLDESSSEESSEELLSESDVATVHTFGRFLTDAVEKYMVIDLLLIH